MSEKRRDNKNRVLHNGESQRKDGRYVYKYTDPNGESRSVYSWRLDVTDRHPAGKPKDLSLREKEKQIQNDLLNGYVPKGGGITVLALVQKYLKLKFNVRDNTRANYNYIVNILKKEKFGRMPIAEVKQSDAKAWFIKMQQEDGRGYSTLHAIRGVLRPAFEMAVQDDLIRKNPFQFELATVVANDSVTRTALTQAQEKAFLEFVQNDSYYRKYYDGIYILLHTGLRISEFCGLTRQDIDFKQNRIRIDHQLQRAHSMEYVIEETKTKNGERFVPMTSEVAECFRRVIKNRKKPRHEPAIDGYTGFLFLDKNGMPMVALHWEKYFQRICQKYNSTHKVQLPKITPHVCRHTFCSNMAKGGLSPKSLQYIMGHSDVSLTLNTYTHLDIEDAQSDFERVMKAE